MTYVGNIDSKLKGYFKLSFIMEDVGNLDVKLRGYFMYFS